jgi:hypothetical protein
MLALTASFDVAPLAQSTTKKILPSPYRLDRQPLKPTAPETDSPEPVSVWPRQQAHPSACVGPGVAVTASWLKRRGRK